MLETFQVVFNRRLSCLFIYEDHVQQYSLTTKELLFSFLFFFFFFKATCPEGYAKLPQSSRSCFSLKTTPLNWEDALYGCALDNGTLASLQSKEESDLVLNLMIGNSP